MPCSHRWGISIFVFKKLLPKRWLRVPDTFFLNHVIAASLMAFIFHFSFFHYTPVKNEVSTRRHMQ